MLKIHNAILAYDSETVLEHLQWQVDVGTTHGLVGLNGAGKTTLLNALYGLIDLAEGQITYNDQPLERRNIAYLEAQNYFYPNITGAEYLHIFRMHNARFDIPRWNQLFDLPLERLVDTYSTGMKKKLALLAALSLDRPVLLLDEPFTGLDMEANQTMKHILNALRDHGATVIITSHIFEALTPVCDAISFLNRKRIEFTLERDRFDELERRIFAAFDRKNERLVQELFSTNGEPR